MSFSELVFKKKAKLKENIKEELGVASCIESQPSRSKRNRNLRPF